MDFLYLALLSFAAGSLLPFPSEALLIPLILKGLSPWALVATASLANSLGALTNTILGRYLRRFSNRSWFYFSEGQILRAEDYFKRYGIACLLFTWLPVVGDPLCAVAGWLKLPFWPCLVYMAIGKLARYTLMTAGLIGLFAIF